MRVNSLVKHRRYKRKIGFIVETLPHVGVAIVHWMDYNDSLVLFSEQRMVDLEVLA